MSNLCVPPYALPPIPPTDESYLNVAMLSVLLVKFEGVKFITRIHFSTEVLEHLIIHALHSNQLAELGINDHIHR